MEPESLPQTLVETSAAGSVDNQYEPFPSFLDWPRQLDREGLWSRRFQELGDERLAAKPQSLADAVAIAMRAAALDTGAIEGLYDVDRGFTLSVATQAVAWQAQLEARGEDVVALFEAQLRSYELVLDVATGRLPITEAWIRRLHEELTAPQETYQVITPLGKQDRLLPRGEYKRDANHGLLRDGSIHAYAPVDATSREMHRLIEEISSPAFDTAHPVLQATYAHYALTAVHPFADGNGRVARALASVYYYRAASIPLLIFADRKLAYFDALAAADAGDRDALLRLFADAGVEAMSLVADTLRTLRVRRPEEAVGSLREILTTQGGLTHQELDLIGVQLLERSEEAVRQRIQELDLPPGVFAHTSTGLYVNVQNLPERASFREVVQGGTRQLQISLSASVPANFAVATNMRVLVSTADDDGESFRLERLDAEDVLTYGLHDVYPQLSVAAEQRLRSFVDRTLSSLLEELIRQAGDALGRVGH